MLPNELTEPNELHRGPNPLGRRISKEDVGDFVTGSVVYWASQWWKGVSLEAMEGGGSTETLLVLENNWERVEDNLRRGLLSSESLVRRRPTRAMGRESRSGEGNERKEKTSSGPCRVQDR